MPASPVVRPRVGVHLALGKGLRRAAERAAQIEARTVQVFVDNPTAWKRRSAPPKGLDAFRERLGALDVAPVAVHASYLVNLAGPDRAFRRRSVEVLASDMVAGGGYGASLVNVHTGSHRDTSVEAGIRRVAEGVAEVLARVPGAAADAGGSRSRPVLVLENASGGGWSVGTTIEEHARIAELAAGLGVAEDRLGFCLDVAHAWGAGVDMGDPEAIDAWLRTFDREIGLARLRMVHFNDSRSELGSRADRHEHVGGGRIGDRGLRHLLAHPDLAGVPFVLETPGMDEGYDRINLERVAMLAAGEPLPPLPPEAFALKRGAAASAPAADDVDPARPVRQSRSASRSSLRSRPVAPGSLRARS